MLKHFTLIAAVLLLASCSKLTMENYQKVKVGMKYDDVVALIGTPESCKEDLGTRRCVWGDEDGDKYIKINFISEAAVMFSHKGLK